jgi:hypothetical protein
LEAEPTQITLRCAARDFPVLGDLARDLPLLAADLVRDLLRDFLLRDLLAGLGSDVVPDLGSDVVPEPVGVPKPLRVPKPPSGFPFSESEPLAARIGAVIGVVVVVVVTVIT